MRVSVGVMAYNEQANMRQILSALLSQRLVNTELVEIIVVASGCTDQTCEIVKGFSEKDSRVRLISQSRREGKASAVNVFLKEASGEILVLESADTLPKEDALERLCQPFSDPQVGACGGHVIPVNASRSFMNYFVNLFWNLHHQVSLIYPKCGEMLAFRNVLPGIVYNTATDETWIVGMLQMLGYKTAYAPEAYVYNKGPQTLKDFFVQRRRHLIGYIHLKKELGFVPRTMDNFLVLRLLLSRVRPKFKFWHWTAGVILLEAAARLLALWDWYVRRRNPYTWGIAPSTKEKITFSDISEYVA